jgi:hypothetical protein
MWWHKPVIPRAWETEIRRIVVPGQPWVKMFTIPLLNNNKNWPWWCVHATPAMAEGEK